MEKKICASTLLFSLVLFAFAASVYAADIQYRYDDLNGLVGVYYVNSQAVGYGYDEAGNRTALSVSGAGAVSVTISPQAVVSSGARWRVDDGVWQASGATVSGLSAGGHTVSFGYVSNWLAPFQ